MALINLTNGHVYKLAKVEGKAVITAGSDYANSPFQLRNSLNIGDSGAPGNFKILSYTTSTAAEFIATHNAQGNGILKLQNTNTGANADTTIHFKGANQGGATHNWMVGIDADKNIFGIGNATQLSVASSSGEILSINEDGHVGIGVVNQTRRFTVRNTAADYLCQFENLHTTEGHGLRIRIEEANNTQTYIRFDRNDGNAIGSIVGDGSGGLTYNESSDGRLKSNIRDCEFTIDDLDKVHMRSYKRGPHDNHVGVIAQEMLETPFAFMVNTGEAWNTQKGLKEGDEEYQYMEVGYNKFIPMLIKSVQDANKMINQLQQEVKKLKEKVDG